MSLVDESGASLKLKPFKRWTPGGPLDTRTVWTRSHARPTKEPARSESLRSLTMGATREAWLVFVFMGRPQRTSSMAGLQEAESWNTDTIDIES